MMMNSNPSLRATTLEPLAQMVDTTEEALAELLHPTGVHPTVQATAPVVHIPFSGRWLHLGATHREPNMAVGVWSIHEWSKLCFQAKAWGLTGLHPKVAEGVYLWYNEAELRLMINVARQYQLQVVPYGYFYGNQFGMIETEAKHIAQLGHLFGAIVLDLEDPWFGHPQWMSDFGKKIREYGFAGPLVVTSYANCLDHQNFPYIQMNEWATAFMPQAYFNVWTSLAHPGHPMSAQEASKWLYGQWVELDKHCRAIGHKPLVPILPLISFEGMNRPVEQMKQDVAEWLHIMQGYGYCGFWYEQVYAPYADTVHAAPMPQIKGTAPVVTHPPVVVVPPTPPPPTPTKPPVVVVPPPPPVVVVPPPTKPVDPPDVDPSPSPSPISERETTHVPVVSVPVTTIPIPVVPPLDESPVTPASIPVVIPEVPLPVPTPPEVPTQPVPPPVAEVPVEPPVEQPQEVPVQVYTFDVKRVVGVVWSNADGLVEVHYQA